MTTTETTIEASRAVMPKGAIYVQALHDYDNDDDLPTVHVRGNMALGAFLAVEVAKILGHLPRHMAQTTGYVEPLAQIAAGLTPTDDDDRGFGDHRFSGDDELAALAQVVTADGFAVTTSRGCVRLAS